MLVINFSNIHLLWNNLEVLYILFLILFEMKKCVPDESKLFLSSLFLTAFSFSFFCCSSELFSFDFLPLDSVFFSYLLNPFSLCTQAKTDMWFWFWLLSLAGWLRCWSLILFSPWNKSWAYKSLVASLHSAVDWHLPCLDWLALQWRLT